MNKIHDYTYIFYFSHFLYLVILAFDNLNLRQWAVRYKAIRHIFLSLREDPPKILHLIFLQMYVLFLFLCLLLNVVLQHTSLYYYVLCTIQVQRHVCGHALFVLFLSENDG